MLFKCYCVPHLPRGVSVAVVLFAGILASLVSGTLYGYATFSPDLKDSLNFTQTDINLASSVGDVGLYLGFIGGIVNDKAGPSVALLVGGLFCGSGYFFVHLASKKVFHASWPLLSVFLFFVGQGSYMAFTAAFTANSKNFSPRFRGAVIGAVVAAFAASSAMFSALYVAFFHHSSDNISKFLLLLSIVCSGTMIIAAIFVCDLSAPAGSKNHHENSSADTSSSTFAGEAARSRDSELQGSVTGGPDSAPARSRYNPLEREETVQGELERATLLSYEDGLHNTPPCRSSVSTSGLGLFRSLDFYLIFVVHFLAAGAGLMWINNQGGAVKSLRLHDDVRSVLVILLAAGSVSGRLLFGALSDVFAARISRAWFIVASATILGILHTSWAFHPKELIYVCTIGTGVAYGSLWAIVISLTSLRFGVEYSGTNVGIVSIAPGMSGLAFNVIAGRIYDSHVVHENVTFNQNLEDFVYASADNQCYGPECFQQAFLISGVASFVAAAIAIVLALRTSPGRMV